MSDETVRHYYKEAVEIAFKQGWASISQIQRRFRITYNTAKCIIDQMEKDGIIGPQDGSKPRQVLKEQPNE